MQKLARLSVTFFFRSRQQRTQRYEPAYVLLQFPRRQSNSNVDKGKGRHVLIIRSSVGTSKMITRFVKRGKLGRVVRTGIDGRRNLHTTKVVGRKYVREQHVATQIRRVTSFVFQRSTTTDLTRRRKRRVRTNVRDYKRWSVSGGSSLRRMMR